MRIKLIACKVFTREAGELAAVSPHFIDITWIRQGFHNEPAKLRQILQETIDHIDAGDDPGTMQTAADSYHVGGSGADFDAIALCYGLCSGGVCGVRSRRYPLVIPRAHDCITLFLGGKERYRALFDEMGGAAFWHNPGWIENAGTPNPATREKRRDALAQRYGAEAAADLFAAEDGWYAHYYYLPYLVPENPLYPDYRDMCKATADYYHWAYREIPADNGLLRELLSGRWDPERFLVLPPGTAAEPSFGEGIIQAAGVPSAGEDTP